MEGVVVSIEFKEEAPWKDMVFFNYNAVVRNTEGAVLTGFISSPNKATTIQAEDRISYEPKQVPNFGLKFDKAKIVPVPVPEMFPEKKHEPIDPLPMQDRRNVDTLKIEALRYAIQFWAGKEDVQDHQKVVLTAKSFFEFLMESPSKSLDLPF
ncbi:MAG: hypothetical protein GQ553_01545 [Nitrosomonadaceae bacterium]|nr:hypothetical protein [Nitrosomonadaceae bacterium]